MIDKELLICGDQTDLSVYRWLQVIFKIKEKKKGHIVAEYLYELEETAAIFASRMKEKGYQVVLLDSPIVSHLIQKLESSNEKLSFARVDGDAIENLIKKEEATVSKLSEEEKEKGKLVEVDFKNKTFKPKLVPKDK